MKKQKLTKTYKRTVLERFYTLKVYELESGKEVPLTDKAYDNFFNGNYQDNQCFVYESENLISLDLDNNIDLNKFMDSFYPTFNKYKNDYEKIKLEFSNYDNSLTHFQIVGYNMETDEEFEERKRILELENQAKGKEKQSQEEKKKQKRIEKLQKELDKLTK